MDKKIFEKIIDEFRDMKNEFDKLPTGLIHNDMVSHNILTHNEHLSGIIDFSDINISPYAQDIAVFIGQSILGNECHPEQATIFLQGYESERKLTAKEKELLPKLIKQRFVCFLLAFSRRQHDYGNDDARANLMKDMYSRLLRFIDKYEKTIIE